ncbi:50S ribosomal protein L4 [Candidatus Sumerlaeota bacterium]|nr:50S ribosomal protein L4 [Candidatus Sumerlaeales bacterium]NLD61071.1 50S ribosomal protein L4 [Candidatus Sumerlaeota bacterium]
MKNMKGADAGTLEVMDAVFSIEPNVNAIRQTYLTWAANQRQGTHSTKTRGMVSGGGKKPFKQKGTGRARQGTSRAPYMPGGAIIFGPQPRDYRQKVNRKVTSLGFKSQLSDLRIKDSIIVLDAIKFDAPKTKDFVTMLAALKAESCRVLLLVNGDEENVYKSAQNLPNVVIARVEALSIYDLLVCDRLIASADSIKKLEERIA